MSGLPYVGYAAPERGIRPLVNDRVVTKIYENTAEQLSYRRLSAVFFVFQYIHNHILVEGKVFSGNGNVFGL